MSILAEITQHKRSILPEKKLIMNSDELVGFRANHPPRAGFRRALENHSPAVIAEVKRASPSKGIIRKDFDPVAIAQSYVLHDAACLSVLTDEKYFHGSPDHLKEIRTQVGIPLLRKDFIVDAHQIAESLVIGADCVLLIVAALTPNELITFHDIASTLGLDVLVEVHNHEELQIALDCDPKLIGINNRDLSTFNTTLDTTFHLIRDIPKSIKVVSESGIHTRTQVIQLREAGVDAFLVGEAFMRQASPGEALRDLFGKITQHQENKELSR